MIIIDRKSKIPLYEQIYNQIQMKIISGDMSEGSNLRPIRVLASELSVSKNTVELAYKQLISEGYISSKKGSGYYVEKMNKFASEGKSYRKQEADKTRKNYLLYDFSADGVSSEEFEWKKWKRCMDEALYEEEYNFSGFKDCRGDINLRNSILHYISDIRGVKCDVRQIVICSGTLYAARDAIETVRKYTGSETGNVSCDRESEKHVFKMFENEGYTPIEFDAGKEYKILYLSPSHRYPLGVTMGLSERRMYIDYADSHDAFIMENDCDSEFISYNERIPSVQALSTGDNVIYISSVSRILSPNIRLAYMVLPDRLVDTYMDMHECFRTAVPVLHQRTLAKYIDMGYMHRHIRKLIRSNDYKLSVITQCLKELEDEGYIKVCGVPQGGYIAIKCEERDDITLNEYAMTKNLRLHYENGYYMIGFLTINEVDIDDAADILYKSVKEYYDR